MVKTTVKNENSFKQAVNGVLLQILSQTVFATYPLLCPHIGRLMFFCGPENKN